MASSKQAKSTLPYLQRLLEDEYVQEQLRTAASGLYAAYGRARKQRAQAAEDKRVYSNVRQAATSLRKAATALQRPAPKPKKRRIPKLATLALVAGGGALLVTKLQKDQSQEA
jgi:ferric-dicitrate binding protein FerR (iron transport regulator)